MKTHRLARPTNLACTALLAASAAVAAAPPHPATLRERWQPTWFSPAQPTWGEGWVLPPGMPAMLRDATLRQTLTSSLGGESLRVVVGNEYGRLPLTIGRAGLGRADATTARRAGAAALHELRFQGRAEVVVAPGARVVSDPVALPLRPGDRLTLDLYLPHETRPAGFHWNAQEQTTLFRGDALGRPDAEAAETLTTRAFVSELLVQVARPPATVVAVGDSITDGNGSTVGGDQRWPDHLARRLAGRGVAVVDAGIAGNRLLRDGWGESALARFERDVLGRAGVRAAIVLLGTNDIGFPGSPFGPNERPVSVRELADGFRRIVALAHLRGVRVVGATVPPFGHALEGTPLRGHDTPEKEALRQALNDWIRHAEAFDAVVDFDAVLADPSEPTRLAPALDSGDHLHPGDAGYRRMAEAIDLAALLGDVVAAGERR